MSKDGKNSMSETAFAITGVSMLVVGMVVLLILPDIKSAAWIVIALGAVFIGASLVIHLIKFRKTFSAASIKFGMGTGIITLIFIAILVLVNAISYSVYQRFDTSGLSQFTLTPQTVKVVENLKVPLRITAFFIPEDSYGLNINISALLLEYQNHSRQISIRFVDPDKNPDVAKNYGINEYQTVVFESGDRKRLIPPSDYIIADDTGRLTGMQAEYRFTSAILEVTGSSQKKVYFLTGNGEAGIESNYSLAAQGLRNDLYIVSSLNLITDPAIPADCAVLILAGPQNLLSEAQVKLINDYLDRGGQALILADPGALAGLARITTRWGIDIDDSFIIDPGSSVAPYENIPFVPGSRNYFSMLPGVYFPGAAPVLPKPDVPGSIQMFPLVWTDSTAWADKNFSHGSVPVFDPGTEKKESLAIGVLIASVNNVPGSDKRFRLAVIGDSEFASNENFNNANNGDLFRNTVGWLATETSLISIHRSAQPFRLLVITAGQAALIKYVSIALIPLLLLIAAAYIWWWRR